MRNLSILLVLLVGIGLISGCSSTSDRHEKIDYVRAKQAIKGLDVPPDLTQPASNDAMALPDAGVPIRGEQVTAATGSTVSSHQPFHGEQVLPSQLNLRIVRDGSLRWLEIDMVAEQLWPQLRDFWVKEGLEIKRDEPAIGIMETEWAENRADVPEGFIRGVISLVAPNVYSAPTRDKYRIRVEPLEEGRSALYLTHYGVEQINVEDSDLEQAVWKPRPSDLELSNEMLNRLLVSLGVPRKVGEELTEEKESVVETPRARLLGSADNISGVVMDEGFAPAWRRVGIVLDRIGLVVEDRNRSAGIYYVAISDTADEAKKKRGWFSSLFSSDDEEAVSPRFRIILKGLSDEQVEITLKRVDGGEVDGKQAGEFLTRLRDGLL